MIPKQHLISFILSFMLATSGIIAQVSTNTTGGNAIGKEGSISYSIGQTTVQTKQSKTGTISEGIQQPYSISIITGKDIKSVNLNYKVYPNPTTDILKLLVDNESKTQLYQLCDIRGKILQADKIINKETIIKMNQYAPSTYILKIIQDKKELKNYKIIKK